MSSRDIALLVQIGTYSRWEALEHLAGNFVGLDDLSCDLYLNVVEDEGLYPASETRAFLAQLARRFPGSNLTTTPNRGTDIGPFLRQIQQILAGGTSYRLLFKLHTKSVEPWTGELCRIMESPDAIRRTCACFDETPDVGLVGSNTWLFPIFQGTSEAYQAALRQRADELGLPIVDPGAEWRKQQARTAIFEWDYYVQHHWDLLPAGIDTEQKAVAHWNAHGVDEFRVPNARFINELVHDGAPISKLLAGTIFACRAEALLPFFEGFDFDGAYNQLETGLVKDGNGTIPRQTHFWERLFGLIVERAGYRLYGLEWDGAARVPRRP